MVEPKRGNWIFSIGFVALSVTLIFFAALPLGLTPAGLTGPDLLLAMSMAWIIRRPETVPVWVIAAVFLFADLLMMRAPGLVTAAVVLASEYLKSREDLTVEVPFALEWSVAGSMIASVMVGTTAMLALFGVPAPSLGAILFKVVVTILVYPFVVLVLRFLVGLSRPAKRRDMGAAR